MVDADGNELSKVNGVYGNQQGYLQIESLNPAYTVAINEGTSKQLGITTSTPTAPGTNRAFSHYFELNNFFESNDPTTTGDTVAGSALNLKVEDRLVNNSNLISLGQMVASTQPADPLKPALYTMVRNNSDNGTIQKLAQLGVGAQAFAAAGGLASTNESYSGYSGQILGYLASSAATATAAQTDSQTLADGFNQKLDSIKGVNIDEELASTIIYQHAYTASARVVTVTDKLFDTLLSMTP